ncbi:unnamed protein product [Rotaria magnacalcarata]|uniref:Uncharacterized protein n=1 Tax=Rotaria magnacalcarata TaxID=392030 RepID=A0A819PTK9_9BILA|nr:unnamed protein product [Rotaria magnacalcarata]CAF2116957.1 unnamed protein product [Rotaria magnacalcarata]CAF4018279.1 unnamed protein product [Rotaria magnacalcarata]CAF4716686.1 unnamed protein product [Rotaria magnacalcarata]
MFNDHLIIDKYVLPKNEQRASRGLRSNRHLIDTFGGFYYNTVPYFGCMILKRIAMVYLPPGTYTFNVSVRSDVATGLVRGGTVLYELTQIEAPLKNVGSFNIAYVN